jgi:hypothetical protein
MLMNGAFVNAYGKVGTSWRWKSCEPQPIARWSGQSYGYNMMVDLSLRRFRALVLTAECRCARRWRGNVGFA